MGRCSVNLFSTISLTSSMFDKLCLSIKKFLKTDYLTSYYLIINIREGCNRQKKDLEIKHSLSLPFSAMKNEYWMWLVAPSTKQVFKDLQTPQVLCYFFCM